MRPVYNVLEEGWIPVVALDGERRLLGIRETLTQAHELKEISVASPLEEYGLYRFLGVFLMDALRPETEEDLEDLLDEGRFDMGQIEKYIDQCRREGVSFDLFDEKRPFLQSAYDEKLDKEVKSVANLDITVPSGNNHAHFDHRSLRSLTMSFDQSARLLIALQLFCTAGAQGYPSGVNASPPFFGVIKGKNLFETLVFTLFPTEKIPIPVDDPPVLWRSSQPVVPKKQVGETSWLRGMIFPARRVLLVPSEAGNEVSGVYLSQGENFVNKESWHDPYVTYKTTKDAVVPLRPSGKRAIWMNYNDLINVPGNHAAQLFRQYLSISEENTANVTLYGVEPNPGKANYLNIYRHDLRFPAGLAGSADKIDVLTNAIALSEKVGRSLNHALGEVKTLRHSLAELSLQQYNGLCEERFWTLCHQLLQEKANHRNLYSLWCGDVGKYGLEVFQKTLGTLLLRASALAEAEKARDRLWKTIQKLKKEANS